MQDPTGFIEIKFNIILESKFMFNSYS